MRSQSQKDRVRTFRQKLSNGPDKRKCNVCSRWFRPHTVFERYCSGCKVGSELLKFSEWLPELAGALTERVVVKNS